MTSEQFAYWFQGFAELNSTPPTQEQWQSIREHLAAVFKKVTPPVAPAVKPPSVFDQKQDLGDIFRREMEKRERDRASPFAWPPEPKYTLIC
ncbi:hypothetical protein [Roseateles sp. P5_E11]